ncbi:MAG: D-alanine--D-alanine ligase [Deltaproteobacteria bacterium]|nr:D-alanine--D-alanine ligase [Deltaproteobacteria bacterium]
MKSKDLKSIKIGVLMGGLSEESEISLKSGNAVVSALKDAGYNVIGIEVDRDIALKIARENIECAFIALHGTYGEDGTIQGLLEVMGVPYTGSGVLASALAMDKAACKVFLDNAGVTTPKSENVKEGESVRSSIGFPVIVKPVKQGSTIGINIANNKEELEAAVVEALKHDDVAMIEELIIGRELTVSVMGDKIFPVLEVTTTEPIYNYKAKYEKGYTDFKVPAELSKDEEDKVKKTALQSYKVLGCRGAARVDIILDEEGTPYVLEVNTIPGMTELSLLPMAAAADGMDFTEVVIEMLSSARTDVN